MAITRVTQSMLTQRSVGALQNGLARLAVVQEQLSTGRVINRPSDSPAGTTSAMRLRSSIAEQQQFARNAQDGLGWLRQTERTVSGMNDQLRRGRELALQGANAATGADARAALAIEVDQIREGLVSAANTTYLGRPVFGGVTGGRAAYADLVGDGSVTFVGVPGSVERTVGSGTTIDVQVDGPSVFGTPPGSVFDDLAALSVALRSGDQAGIAAGIEALKVDMDRMTSAVTDLGTRTNRMEAAEQAALDAELALSSSLSEIENTDLPRAMVDLQMQEVAYQAALASTARVLQPSLVDFLR